MPTSAAPGTVRDRVLGLLGGLLQRVEVVAVDLHRDLAELAGDVLVDVVADRLGEVVLDARDLPEVLLHLGDEIVQGLLAVPPLVERLQLDEDLEVVGQRGVGAVLGAAELGQQLGDLGRARRALLDRGRRAAGPPSSEMLPGSVKVT